MRGLGFVTGHVIYNPAYTYKFQLKTTLYVQECGLANYNIVMTWSMIHTRYCSILELY